MRGNSYFEILRRCVFAATVLMLFSAPPAGASEEISLYSDHSMLIRLPKRPGTIVVGNPSIADVTLDGENLFLHGRGFGSTNLTVLDESGHAIGDYEIFVTLQEANSATVYKNGARQSYSCADDCQPVLTVGDLYERHFKDLGESIKTKTKISRDQLGGEGAAAPVMIPAPLTQ